MSGHRYGDSIRQDPPAGRLDPMHAARVQKESGDLAAFDDIDTAGIGGAGIAPSDGVVADGTCPPLQQPAADRKAGRRRVVEVRQETLYLAAIQQLGLDPVEAHDVAP